MYEQNNTPPDEPTAQQDAIDINDLVFAATGARVRRLTTPDGEHWFVAADVATDLGYANTRQALLWHVTEDCTKRLDEIAQGVYGTDTSSKLAAHKLQRSMKLVNLRGLIALVTGCTKQESQPFKAWVSEFIVTIQRDGSYALEPSPVQPAPTGGTAYAMPDQVADAIVRLEERNSRADEMLTAFQEERNDLLRQISASLQDIAATLRRPTNHALPTPEPELTPPRTSSLLGRRRTSWSPRTFTRSRPTSPRRWCAARPGTAWRRSPPVRGCHRNASTTACGCCSGGDAYGRRVAHRTERRCTSCRNALAKPS